MWNLYDTTTNCTTMKSIPHFIKGSETAIEIPKEGTMLMLLCGKDALTMYYKTVKLRDVTKILSICLACIRQKTFFPSKKILVLAISRYRFCVQILQVQSSIFVNIINFEMLTSSTKSYPNAYSTNKFHHLVICITNDIR